MCQITTKDGRFEIYYYNYILSSKQVNDIVKKKIKNLDN